MLQHRVPDKSEPPAPASYPIRPANPEDSEFLAQGILHASRSHLSRGLWDILVEGPEDERLAFLELMTLLEERSFCHYTNFMVAETAGEPVATMCGFDPGDPELIGPGYAIAIAGEQFGLSETDILNSYRQLETYNLALPEQLKGVWTIEWVWTVPDRRRSGMCQALIERIVQEGRGSGYSRAQVTTFIGNSAAERAYEKFGFQVAEQRRHPHFERMMGSPGLSRFEFAMDEGADTPLS